MPKPKWKSEAQYALERQQNSERRKAWWAERRRALQSAQGTSTEERTTSAVFREQITLRNKQRWGCRRLAKQALLAGAHAWHASRGRPLYTKDTQSFVRLSLRTEFGDHVVDLCIGVDTAEDVEQVRELLAILKISEAVVFSGNPASLDTFETDQRVFASASTHAEGDVVVAEKTKD